VCGISRPLPAFVVKRNAGQRHAPNRDNHDEDRDVLRLLAIRAVRRPIPVALWGIAVHYTLLPGRV